MSKAQVITFPFALLLLDYWPLDRLGQSVGPAEAVGGEPAVALTSSLWSLIAEKVPWFALSAASAIVTMRTGGAAFSYVVLTDATLPKLPIWIRLGTAAIGYVKYLGKAFWPANLALVYPHPGLAIGIPAAALSVLALVAVTALVVIFRQRRPLFVGWFWFLGTLVPMIGIVQIGAHSMADRYAYIPLLGIFV